MKRISKMEMNSKQFQLDINLILNLQKRILFHYYEKKKTTPNFNYQPKIFNYTNLMNHALERG